MRTLANYRNNAFVSFLFNIFPEDVEKIEKAVKDYLIGTTTDGKTIFWQIDRRRNIRTGKIIAYDAATGKRRKDINPNWIHAQLKKSGHLKADFNLRQCFFGEHLLPTDKTKTLAIVEAEKTAIIASICFPEFLWCACGAKQNLNAEKLRGFDGRQIILYPDADSFALWTEKAREARANGLTVNVSSLIENHGTDAQKTDGCDLADYLIAERVNRRTSQNTKSAFLESTSFAKEADENQETNFKKPKTEIKIQSSHFAATVIAETTPMTLITRLNEMIAVGVSFEVSADEFQTLGASEREICFLNYNEAAILCTLHQSLLVKYLPKGEIKNFVMEIRERTAILSDGAAINPPFVVVAEISRKWFADRLEKLLKR